MNSKNCPICGAPWELHDSDSPCYDKLIRLSNIEGIARKSGIDQHGNRWIEYSLDFPDDPDYKDECCVCGKLIQEGWLCGDGGEVACYDCVTLPK